MGAPHRKSPNRLRELREQIEHLVRMRMGFGMICGRCGARYGTMDDKCEADLGQPCPGSNAIDLVRLRAEREVGLER